MNQEVEFIRGPTEPGHCWNDGTELEFLGLYVITEREGQPEGDPAGVAYQCPKCKCEYAFYDSEWHSFEMERS
jgi:hypothetical protein